MKPIGPLMIEHRTMEQMLRLLTLERERILKTGNIDHGALQLGIDFFRMYVDDFHHGKEEHVFFKTLDKKPLAQKDRQIMNELIEEHSRARKVIELLQKGIRNQDAKGMPLGEITDNMEKLLTWQPAHIEKEDKNFFISSMDYLSVQEQASMLEELKDYNRNFVQQRYTAVIRELAALQRIRDEQTAA